MMVEMLAFLAVKAAIDVDNIILGRFGNSSVETNLEPLKDWLCEAVCHFGRCGKDEVYFRSQIMDKRQSLFARTLDFYPDPKKNSLWSSYFDQLVNLITPFLCTLQVVCHDPSDLSDIENLKKLRVFCTELSAQAQVDEFERTYPLRLAA